MKTAEDYTNGQVLLIDKPLTWSSFQAVNKVKYALKRQFGFSKKFKIGHAGTLDPLATGLLIICTGKFTKKIAEIQGQTKEYTGTFFLGETTPSYDKETQPNATFPTAHITEALLNNVVAQLTGEIDQVPPVFSAVKKDGKRLYEHARAGESVEIESRKVTVYEFELTRIALPEVDFRISCSKGTYIRSIANDFGKLAASGAYLAALRRTKIGSFSVDDAITPLAFEAQL